jgi:hypothetical protein
MLTLSMSAFRGNADIPSSLANDPKRTSPFNESPSLIARTIQGRWPFCDKLCHFRRTSSKDPNAELIGTQFNGDATCESCKSENRMRRLS